jgi:hypothetical protein
MTLRAAACRRACHRSNLEALLTPGEYSSPTFTPGAV